MKEPHFTYGRAVGRGSAPVPGVGESVPFWRTCRKACFGETPKPTGGTPVLPGNQKTRFPLPEQTETRE